MHSTKRLMPFVVITTLLMGCGGSASAPTSVPPGGGGGPPSTSATVTVGNDFFRSNRNRTTNTAVDTVVAGGKVTWTWSSTGSVSHSVQSLGAPTFTSGPIVASDGNTYEQTFPTPGTYRYNCAVHGNLMTGTIVVIAQ